MSSELDLQMNTWNDSMTLNPYSIIQIKGENSASAENLEQFILSPTGQAIIANHSIAGSHLFNPGQPNQEPFNNA
jgi:ABC-type tungstate transport system permease subunit